MEWQWKRHKRFYGLPTSEVEEGMNRCVVRAWPHQRAEDGRYCVEVYAIVGVKRSPKAEKLDVLKNIHRCFWRDSYDIPEEDVWRAVAEIEKWIEDNYEGELKKRIESLRNASSEDAKKELAYFEKILEEGGA